MRSFPARDPCRHGSESVQSQLEADILRDEKALAEYKLQGEKPFEHEARPKELLAEQAHLNAALDLAKDDSRATVVGNDQQEIGRDVERASDAPVRGSDRFGARAGRLVTAEAW